MNVKKSACCQRKRSHCLAGSSKGPSTTTHKKGSKELTRNVSHMEGFDSNYSAIMDTYSDLMAKKRKAAKGRKKENSQSFHHQPKSSERRKCYIQNYIRTVNKYLGKENCTSAMGKHAQKKS